MVFFIVVYQVKAVPVIDLKINQEFKINETVILEYSIISDIEENIEYIADVVCSDAPHSQLELKTANVKPNIPLVEKFVYLTVNDNIEPQTCNATIMILEPYSIIESMSIKIITNPSFEFEIKQCKDSLCNFEAEVFEFNKEVYLDYFSNVNEISAHAKIIYPDKTSNQITLPSSIKSSQIGTYTLDITASKQGYKTVRKTEQFAVIEKETPIKDASLCNGNNICDNKETRQNCPQDCQTERQISTTEKSQSEKGIFNNEFLFISGGIFLLIVLLSVVMYLKNKK